MQCDFLGSSPFSCKLGCHVWRWQHHITLRFEESRPEIYALDLHEREILYEDTLQILLLIQGLEKKEGVKVSHFKSTQPSSKGILSGTLFHTGLFFFSKVTGLGPVFKLLQAPHSATWMQVGFSYPLPH